MAKKKVVKKTKKKGKKAKKGKKKKGGFKGLLIAVAVVAAVIMIGFFKRGEPVKYIKADKLAEFGGHGEKKGSLNSPRGIAVAPDNTLLVASLNNNRIDRFKLNGEYVASYGEKGDKKGQFKEPSGVSVDRDGNFYVADAWNGRIQKFDKDGKFLLEVGGEKAGFYSPRNVAINQYGVMFVADTGTSRIHRFDVDGNRIGKPFGARGKSLGNFQEVFGIAFDSQNRVYVGDPGNRRIDILSSDLNPIGQIEVKAWQEAAPMWPHVAVDSQDRLYAVSSGTKEIWVYNTKHPKFKYIGTIKTGRDNRPLFADPLGIAIDKEDNIYISEVNKGTIVKIKPLYEAQK